MLESNRLDAGVWGLPGTVPYPPQAPSAGVEPATSGIATRRSDPWERASPESNWHRAGHNRKLCAVELDARGACL